MLIFIFRYNKAQAAQSEAERVRLQSKIDFLTEVVEAWKIHHKFKQSQRECYNTQLENLQTGSGVLVMDFKQNIELGAAAVEVFFVNKKQKKIRPKNLSAFCFCFVFPSDWPRLV